MLYLIRCVDLLLKNLVGCCAELLFCFKQDKLVCTSASRVFQTCSDWKVLMHLLLKTWWIAIVFAQRSKHVLI